MALATLQEVKDWIGGFDPADTSQDARLNLMLSAADKIIKDYCETEFVPTAETNEVLDGTRSDVIVPKNSPIISVQKVVFNVNTLGQGGTQLATDEFYFTPDAIILSARMTPQGRGLVRLDYTHGYASVPEPVKMACLMAVEGTYRRLTRGTLGLSSRAKEGESESYLSAWNLESGLPKEAMALLVPYRSIEIPVQNMAQRNS